MHKQGKHIQDAYIIWGLLRKCLDCAANFVIQTTSLTSFANEQWIELRLPFSRTCLVLSFKTLDMMCSCKRSEQSFASKGGKGGTGEQTNTKISAVRNVRHTSAFVISLSRALRLD